MTPIALDPAVLELAERAGEHRLNPGNDTTLEFTADLETLHEITHDGGAYQVWRTSRGARGGYPILSSPDLRQIEKYLTYLFGRDLRYKLRMPGRHMVAATVPRGRSAWRKRSTGADHCGGGS